MPDPDSTAELLDDQVVSLAPARRESSRPAGRWVIVAGSLVVVLGAVLLSAKWSGPPLAAVASPSSAFGLAAPTPLTAATLQPTPTADSGPCGTGRIEVDPVIDPIAPEGIGPIRPPRGGLLATAIEQGPTEGSIVVSQTGDDGASVARVVAKVHGREIQDQFGVIVVGWSGAGDTFLVRAGHLSPPRADRTCADLFLVYADGSGVKYLTGHDPSDWISSTTLAPRTGQIAFVRDGELLVPDTEAPSGFASLAPCTGAATIRWSPDERRLFAICEGWFVMAGASDPTALYPIQPGITPMSAVWSSDSSSITLVSDNGAAGSIPAGPLAVLDVDFATGATRQRVETYMQAQWKVPSPFISPDGKWLLAEAFVPGNDEHAFTALDLTTGATTRVPWPIPPDEVGEQSFAWLPDNETMLYADQGTLYALNVRQMTRTEVGSVPAPDFAWLNRAP